MKGPLKFAAITVGMVLILIAILALVAATQLDKIVEPALEYALTESMGSAVEIESMRVAPFAHSLIIENLTVSNPEGFRKGPAVKFGTIRIKLNPKSLITGTLIIGEVLIENTELEIRYELGKGTNIGKLTKDGPEQTEDEESDKEDEQEDAWGFMIRELRCEEAKVKLTSNLVPLSSIRMNVAPFTLTEIGPDRIVTSHEVTAIVLKTIMTETLGLKGMIRPVANLIRGEFGREENKK